jgi:hypothetical protein
VKPLRGFFQRKRKNVANLNGYAQVLEKYGANEMRYVP